MTLTTQFTTLLAMMATGMGMAGIFDLYTWSRAKLRMRKWFTFLFDTLYWVLFAMAVLVVLYNVNDGRLRIPLFFAILFGGICYFHFFSRLFMLLWDRIVTIVVRIFMLFVGLIRTIIVLPTIWMFSTIVSILLWFGTGLWSFVRVVFGWLTRPILSIYRKIHDFILALGRKIGTMIIDYFKRKPPEE